MRLNEIKNGETIFIDTNIFIYHFAGASSECKDFLKRCAKKEVLAFTSLSVLAETCHRLMSIEAVKLKVIQSKNPALQLQRKPELIKKLSIYYAQMTNILDWNIGIIPDPEDIIIKSQIYRQRFGMLTNDSFIPVSMESAGTANLASADRIFDAIPHINLFAPSDIHL